MPSISRRRERHLEAVRFESEMRQSDLEKFGRGQSHGKRIFQCEVCQHLFEERSRTCPRCEKGKTMGELRPIRSDRLAEYNQQSVNRIRRAP